MMLIKSLIHPYLNFVKSTSTILQNFHKWDGILGDFDERRDSIHCSHIQILPNETEPFTDLVQ